MSQTSDADSQQIPPIEIGSFIALRPDKSEFIGSASGVFFANTVFRAFATATTTSGGSAAKRPQGDVDGLGATVTPDPGSAHEYVMAEEKAQEKAQEEAQEEAAGDDVLGVGVVGVVGADDADDASKSLGVPSYGIAAPGLGKPPPLAVAKRLLVEYFRRWHPFLPFLHGPTFFDKVNGFYEPDGSPAEPMSQRNKVYQAIIFQCVFNIADSNHNQKQERELPEESRIKSAVALTSLLGILSSGHDIPSLQALLAVELYLMTQMSLRAASTVHGAMTRILYHCGLHRCPFRYVQLPRDICDMRKRIFWSAYVIDRHLSQVLGHPLALNDEEIDVCLPGAPEVHNPAKPFQHMPRSRSSAAEHDVQAYAPVDHPTFGSLSSTGDLTDGSTIGTHDDGINTDQLVYRPQSLGESILGFLVTYSRLLGQALDLFHKSIYSRSITWDKVLEMTTRIHAWWNTLPPSFQGEGLTSIFVEPQSHHGPPFAILYHQLILIMNRPFLSLPTNRTDFQFSLQTAVNASRAIVKKLKLRQGDSPLVAWPGMLSAAWMAGLVIAYAGLLKLYPMEKTVLDLNCAIRLLGMMSRNWSSAHHCRVTLKMLLDRLTSKPFMDKINPALSADPSLSVLTDWSQPVFSTYQNLLEGSRSKRRRVAQANNKSSNGANNNNSSNNNNNTNFMGNSMSGYPANHFIGLDTGFMGGDNLWDYPSFQPVLEYTGPDFGFDADQFSQQGEWERFLSENMNPESSGLLFSSAGWDTYVQNLGDRLNV
ncbi:fungal-specific transcription factor domain-containing protein [Trichoderma ceciliae]